MGPGAPRLNALCITLLAVAGIAFSTVADPRIEGLGCWTDNYSRAIPTLEGIDSNLDGSYRRRENPFEKCYEAARKRGYEVFALQHGGWCASSSNAQNTYQKYGGSNNCNPEGTGGGFANQVYRILPPACISIAMDSSESIADSAAKNEMADILHEIVDELTTSERLARYHLDINLVPFNDGAVRSGRKDTKSLDYPTRDAFIAEEVQSLKAIFEMIRQQNNTGLTDMSSMLEYVGSDVQCVGDQKGLIVVSDFLITKNRKTFEQRLDGLRADGYKVFPVGLSKMRSESNFKVFKDADGIFVDMRDRQTGDLKAAVDKLFE